MRGGEGGAALGPAGVEDRSVGEHDPHVVVLIQPAKLDLEIDQRDADAEEQTGEEIVDAQGEGDHVVHILRRRPAERGDVLFSHHRVLQRVVLVIILDDRARQPCALGNAESLGQRTRGHVAHNHLDRDDLDFADQLLTHVEPADEMRGHADLTEAQHQILAVAVVQHALAGDGALFLGVERGGVILEILHEGSGFRPFEQDLGFALVELAAAGHWRFLGGDLPHARRTRRRGGARV